VKLGDVLRLADRPDEAAELLGPVHDAASATLGANDPLVRPLAQSLAAALRLIGAEGEAAALEAAELR
jgi:hypothetical protein